ncbi:Penicillin acylase 2 precursor [Vibrio ruber DSM 16370]|uniref:Penicillin acylase 2 n=1 Tax=Vibrio ruber (strain DSM 16370 / JCM 11486 / BCRC 17186 / CECT 7878 / LMG 23124 / VR1) TaxID=1123498 RepID=A0A1R4LBC5_VIBR1|nr:penicillin acylase family protein [Vibrio ruber]SJN53703.1 Penicillin acylase 2 precursor [Vibrio ruber DSM 16370]
MGEKVNLIKSKKFIFYILLLISGLILASLYYILSQTESQRTGTVKLNGLDGPVFVFRDNYGIPHIDALTSDADAFYALGYLHAQDRFWQMELQRLTVKGQLSEVFGADTVETDKFMRTWGFYRSAEQSWPKFTPKQKALIVSYTQGVNAFIAQQKLPIEFKIFGFKPQRWSETDSIAWQKMLAYNLQSTWSEKLKNQEIMNDLGEAMIPVLHPKYPDSGPTIMSESDLRQITFSNKDSVDNSQIISQNSADADSIFASSAAVKKVTNLFPNHTKGSNNWVLSGSKTSTGKPILANDLHLGLSSPSLFYLAEIKGPTLHVTGATIPGVPGVIEGHNDHIAWGSTNVNPNDLELIVEDGNNKIFSRDEVIKVKGEEDVKYQVLSTKNGPIINDYIDLPSNQDNKYISIQWSALMDTDVTVGSFIEMNYARNWQDFLKALSTYVTPAQNFVYADTEGNIGYKLAGKVPLRAQTAYGLVSSQSWQGWQGYIPFDQLPQSYNPKTGFIASANNKAAPDSYPYQIDLRWMAAPYRVERIIELISSKSKLSMKDNIDIQNDVKNEIWHQLRPILLTTKPLNKESKEGLEYLKSWDGHMTENSIAASIFAYWDREINRLYPSKYQSDSDEPLFIFSQLSHNGQYCQKAGFSDCDAFLQNSLQVAMQKLIDDQGNTPENWHWGEIHIASFKNSVFGDVPLLKYIFNRQVSTAGGNQTINDGGYDHSFTQVEGASYRHIINLNDLDDSLFIHPLGQSENPLDENYDNLLEQWKEGNYITIKAQNVADTCDISNEKQIESGCLILQPVTVNTLNTD